MYFDQYFKVEKQTLYSKFKLTGSAFEQALVFDT